MTVHRGPKTMAAKDAAPHPLSSEGVAQAVDLHETYEVTNFVLGSGADGGISRGTHQDSGVSHALKYLSRHAYCAGEHRELAILQKFQKHPRPNVLALIADFAPIAPSRPQWVLATQEADCNLRTSGLS